MKSNADQKKQQNATAMMDRGVAGGVNSCGFELRLIMCGTNGLSGMSGYPADLVVSVKMRIPSEKMVKKQISSR